MSYICAKKECRHEIRKEELAGLPGIKCSMCGNRILFKKRPEIVKRVKAI